MLRIIVPLHNDKPWLQRCLASIQHQIVTNWMCYLADDCSDDESWNLAQAVVGADPRFVLSRNCRRLYQCGTYRRLLGDPLWPGVDVCVSVDADDYLPDEQVFSRILAAYADGATWLTWGSHSRTDGEPGICGPLEDAAKIRQVKWRTSQLRTWRLFLWRKIRPDDFLGPDGEPLRVAGDLASMFPMVEMAGDRHIKYLESINYVYNRSNPLSNFRVRREEQKRNDAFLRAKLPYQPLPDNALENCGGALTEEVSTTVPVRFSDSAVAASNSSCMAPG